MDRFFKRQQMKGNPLKEVSPRRWNLSWDMREKKEPAMEQSRKMNILSRVDSKCPGPGWESSVPYWWRRSWSTLQLFCVVRLKMWARSMALTQGELGKYRSEDLNPSYWIRLLEVQPKSYIIWNLNLSWSSKITN